jgi:hypothetical protein
MTYDIYILLETFHSYSYRIDVDVSSIAGNVGAIAIAIASTIDVSSIAGNVGAIAIALAMY